MRQLHYGLKIWEVAPQTMQANAHQHNEIELIYIEQGHINYLYRAETYTLKTGDVMIFWATIPHQLLEILEDCIMHIITIPLQAVFRWSLPDTFINSIMDGTVLIHQNLLGNAAIIQHYFRQWKRDLQMADTERREIVLLELQALIKRWCLYFDSPKKSTHEHRSSTQIHAQAIAQYIASHYTEVISLKHIAQAVGINPSYASSIFTQELRMSIWHYLAQYRVAHAQRLLLLTKDPIPQIAEASGFTSLSQFYAVFKKHCQKSPKQFRLSLS